MYNLVKNTQSRRLAVLDELVSVLYHSIHTAIAQTKLGAGELYLACSGGRDSLALAYACYQLYQAGCLDKLPEILHVHHGWQAANDDWAALVADWARAHHFSCRVLSVQLQAHSETAARQARYEALLSVMADGDVLLLGHHGDDQAETVLMRLINGGGVTGLVGMRTWQAKQGDGKQVWLYRPWLEVSRQQISDYAYSHQLPFVDDKTNLDVVHTRGFLRTEVLPKLAQINPAVVMNIARTAHLMADADAVINDAVAPFLADATDSPCMSLSAAQLMDAPDYLQKTIIHRWLMGGEPLPPHARLVAQVLALMGRRDNDHATCLYWQAVYHEYYISAYDGVLYRYRSDVWQWLKAPADQHTDTATKHLIYPSLPKTNQLLPIDKNTVIRIGRYDYRAKKLAQRLRIPLWLRGHLWVIMADDAPVGVTTIDMAWRIPSGERDDGFALRFRA